MVSQLHCFGRCRVRQNMAGSTWQSKVAHLIAGSQEEERKTGREEGEKSEQNQKHDKAFLDTLTVTYFLKLGLTFWFLLIPSNE